MNNYLIVFIFLSIIILGISKKVNIFKAFEESIQNTLKVILNLFVYIFTFTYAITLFHSSGLIEDLVGIILRKINPDLILQVIIRPFSSSSSLSLMLKIYEMTGINSFESIFSTLIHSGVDAIFYVIGLYQSLLNIENTKIIKHSIVLYLISFIVVMVVTFIVKRFILI